MGSIVCITGSTAAGKSVLARHLSSRFSLPQFTPGDYQRQKFASEGFKSPAEYHKQLGLQQTYYALWPEFIEQMRTNMSEHGMIVGGIYTLEFLELIKQEFPTHRTHLLIVAAKQRIRFQRFMTREKLKGREAEMEFHALEASKKAAGLFQLLRHCDVIVRNQTTMQDFFEEGECTFLILQNRGISHAG